MIRWLTEKFYARCRRIDLEILWPACRDRADSMDAARAAFAAHAFHDSAWMVLGEAEVYRIIDGLE